MKRKIIQEVGFLVIFLLVCSDVFHKYFSCNKNSLLLNICSTWRPLNYSKLFTEDQYIE